MKQVVFNTATREKEEFQPLESGKVKMYVCGPTVYDLLHVGNFRGAVFFNLVANWFRHQGYDVTFVYNFTDVDDRIIAKSIKENVRASEVSERYIAEFKKDFTSLRLTPHDHNPKVTEHIPQTIAIVERLVENGKAYVVDGEVVYRVESFEPYGKLSGKALEDLISGARVEIDERKGNPLDFVLWKPSKEGEPAWDSPWGPGRPGWHIECSAMCTHILGETIDIHGGGIDLIFPHHENEIAQSEGATGKPFVRYWMHNNFINFGAHKMSKSLGNVTTARAFLERFHPEILKMLLLSAHYRSPLDFSDAPIHNVIQRLARIYSALSRAKGAVESGVDITKPPEAFVKAIDQAEKEIESSLLDDFNTPEVFARIFEVVRIFNNLFRPGQKVTPENAAMSARLVSWLQGKGALMALFQEEPKSFLFTLDDMLLEQKELRRSEIDQIVAERAEARAARDFSKSDALRDRLAQMGIDVHDSAQGTVWEVKK